MNTAHLCGTSQLQLTEHSYIYQVLAVSSYLATISSDDSIRLVDPTNLRQVSDGVWRNAHAGITSLASPSSPSVTLVSAGRDAVVRAWDVRSKAPTISLDDNETRAPYVSLACSEQLVAAGTELTNSQAAISIWQVFVFQSNTGSVMSSVQRADSSSVKRDVRSPGKVLRRYVESHNDDITELSFHPSDHRLILSGGTDSLLNIFDTNQSEEEDALLTITNHGSSIHHADFLSPTRFFGLSHDENLSVYGIDEPLTNGDPAVNEVRRIGDVREPLNCEYVVNITRHSEEESILAAGAHSLQSLHLYQLRRNGGEWELDRENAISLPGAHGEEIVRSFVFNNDQTIFTAGEDGLIKAWRTGDDKGYEDEEASSSQKKSSKKGTAEHRYKPY